MSPFRASAPLTDSWEHFEFTVDDGVATVTFDRPEKLNALTFDVYADLRDLVAELPHRGDVQVLVLTGKGRGFCSGGDVEEIIGELQKMDTAELLEFTRMTGAVVKAMRETPIPIIAAINGVAAGAGSVLALASDFRLLAESAKFAFLFTKVGLAGADMGSAYLLPRLVGLGRATELLMLGDKLPPRAPKRSDWRTGWCPTPNSPARPPHWRDGSPTVRRWRTPPRRCCSPANSTATSAVRSNWKPSRRRC